jgi:hypothetical protein
VDFLKKNLTSGNAFLLLTQARLFDEPQLADLCLDTIDKHTTDAVQAEGFVDIDLDTLCCVLQRDTLRITESKLFQVRSWPWTLCIEDDRFSCTSFLLTIFDTSFSSFPIIYHSHKRNIPPPPQKNHSNES